MLTAIEIFAWYVLLNLTGAAGSVVYLKVQGRDETAKSFLTFAGFIFCALAFWPTIFYILGRRAMR